MERLALSPVHLTLGLGICLFLCLIVMVYSVVRIRTRWREGQQALKQLHESVRDLELEMQLPVPSKAEGPSVGTPTSGAESEARSE